MLSLVRGDTRFDAQSAGPGERAERINHMSKHLGSLALVPVVICGLAVSGCGTTPGDRGLSGGLLGAGTGAVIGSMAGSAGTGALLGGLGGAAIGMLTSSDTINLGEPAWHRTASSHRHRANVARNDGNCTVHETATKRVTTCTRER
jgi:hypothetical protein